MMYLNPQKSLHLIQSFVNIRGICTRCTLHTCVYTTISPSKQSTGSSIMIIYHFLAALLTEYAFIVGKNKPYGISNISCKGNSYTDSRRAHSNLYAYTDTAILNPMCNHNIWHTLTYASHVHRAPSTSILWQCYYRNSISVSFLCYVWDSFERYLVVTYQGSLWQFYIWVVQIYLIVA